MDFKDKKIAILGFGLEGKDLAEFLLKHEAVLTIFDQKEESELDFSGLDRKKFNLITGKKYLSKGLDSFDLIFRSPGVYRYIPEIITAEKKGVHITSATKLFFDLSPAKIIGVTGTKGKGTTSTLLYEILKKAGKDVYLAGNIGFPILKLLSQITPQSYVVLELSSFQLIDLHKSPHISVVLNITVDHMDWHKNIEEYIEAKKNIVRHQSNSDFAVINKGYKSSASFANYTSAKIHYFSKKTLAKKYKQNLLLKGEHNLENIAAAVKVAKLLKISDKVVLKVLSGFKGLEHRLEFVGAVGGISFYNDSFSTNPQTTIAAVKSFDQPITLIVGGFDKKLNYDQMAREIAKSSVISCVLIGDIREKIKKSLISAGYKRNIYDMGYSEMSEIVAKCVLETGMNGIVLLSPASSSFDMFKDYKERGKQFKECVRHITKTS